MKYRYYRNGYLHGTVYKNLGSCIMIRDGVFRQSGFLYLGKLSVAYTKELPDRINGKRVYRYEIENFHSKLFNDYIEFVYYNYNGTVKETVKVRLIEVLIGYGKKNNMDTSYFEELLTERLLLDLIEDDTE